MDDTLAAGLAVQKARKVTEAMIPTLLPDVVKAHLPLLLDEKLPVVLRDLTYEAVADTYAKSPPTNGRDGAPGVDGKAGDAGPRGPAGPSGFSRTDADRLMAAWADLRAAILTPRKRTVIRDNLGRITGLTEG